MPYRAAARRDGVEPKHQGPSTRFQANPRDQTANSKGRHPPRRFFGVGCLALVWHLAFGSSNFPRGTAARRAPDTPGHIVTEGRSNLKAQSHRPQGGPLGKKGVDAGMSGREDMQGRRVPFPDLGWRGSCPATCRPASARWDGSPTTQALQGTQARGVRRPDKGLCRNRVSRYPTEGGHECLGTSRPSSGWGFSRCSR